MIMESLNNYEGRNDHFREEARYLIRDLHLNNSNGQSRTDNHGRREKQSQQRTFDNNLHVHRQKQDVGLDLIASSSNDAGDRRQHHQHRGGMGQPVGAELGLLGAGDYELMDGNSGLLEHTSGPGPDMAMVSGHRASTGTGQPPPGNMAASSRGVSNDWNRNGHSSVGQFDRHNWDSPPPGLKSDKKSMNVTGYSANHKSSYPPHSQGSKYGMSRSNSAANANERLASGEISPTLVTESHTKNRGLRPNERNSAISAFDPSPSQSNSCGRESYDRSVISRNSSQTRSEARSTWITDDLCPPRSVAQTRDYNAGGYGGVPSQTSHVSGTSLHRNDQTVVSDAALDDRRRDFHHQRDSFSTAHHQREASYSNINNGQRSGSVSSGHARGSPAGSQRSSIASNSSGDTSSSHSNRSQGGGVGPERRTSFRSQGAQHPSERNHSIPPDIYPSHQHTNSFLPAPKIRSNSHDHPYPAQPHSTDYQDLWSAQSQGTEQGDMSQARRPQSSSNIASGTISSERNMPLPEGNSGARVADRAAMYTTPATPINASNSKQSQASVRPKTGSGHSQGGVPMNSNKSTNPLLRYEVVQKKSNGPSEAERKLEELTQQLEKELEENPEGEEFGMIYS